MSQKTTLAFITVCLISLIFLSSPMHGFIFDDDYLDQYSEVERDVAQRGEMEEEYDSSGVMIDPEEDLMLNEIINIGTTMLIAFSIVLLISLIAALKESSGSILIIGIVIAIMVAGSTGVIYVAESTIIAESLQRTDEEFWEAITISDFELDVLEDISGYSEREIVPEALSQELSLVEDIGHEVIENATLHEWSDEDYSRELFIIEFSDHMIATVFTDLFLEVERSIDLRNSVVFAGRFESENPNYQVATLMEGDRFIFLSFSSELHSLYAMNRILSDFPERYSTGDTTAPSVEEINPYQGVANESDLSFEVYDMESGINPLSIRVVGIDEPFDPLKDCREMDTDDEDRYLCTIEDAIEEEGSFTIIVSDNEMNNEQYSIEYESE